MKILTGMGRSGTSFISKMINDCTDKTSKHEYIKKSLYEKLPSKCFIDHIEVNSYCRYDMHNDEVRFILLLRSPIDIALSISKRYVAHKRRDVLEEMSRWYEYLENNIVHAESVFFFDRYTQEPDYLLNLLHAAGCQNIDEGKLKSSISLKVNSSPNKSATLEEVYTDDDISLINQMEKKYEKYKNIYNR